MFLGLELFRIGVPHVGGFLVKLEAGLGYDLSPGHLYHTSEAEG